MTNEWYSNFISEALNKVENELADQVYPNFLFGDLDAKIVLKRNLFMKDLSNPFEMRKAIGLNTLNFNFTIVVDSDSDEYVEITDKISNSRIFALLT